MARFGKAEGREQVDLNVFKLTVSNAIVQNV